jgi:hypothetical protein
MCSLWVPQMHWWCVDVHLEETWQKSRNVTSISHEGVGLLFQTNSEKLLIHKCLHCQSKTGLVPHPAGRQTRKRLSAPWATVTATSQARLGTPCRTQLEPPANNGSYNFISKSKQRTFIMASHAGYSLPQERTMSVYRCSTTKHSFVAKHKTRAKLSVSSPSGWGMKSSQNATRLTLSSVESTSSN